MQQTTMKKIILGACMVLASIQIHAQVQTPHPSPDATLEQTVGLTEVSINYSRPSLKGRTIFGDLVPYDQLWRTGANGNTIISFSDPVTMGDQTLAKGSYALYTKPGKGSWEVYFYTATDNWGNPTDWDESKVAARLSVTPVNFPFKVETFTISIDDLSANGAVLGVLWENTYVGIPFGVPSEEKAMASIESALNGPKATDYFSAAVYYLEEGKDLKQAEQWMDKAIGMHEQPPFWMLYQQSLLQHANGKTKVAIETANRSMKAAEAAGNSDYVSLNQKSIGKWTSK